MVCSAAQEPGTGEGARRSSRGAPPDANKTGTRSTRDLPQHTSICRYREFVPTDPRSTRRHRCCNCCRRSVATNISAAAAVTATAKSRATATRANEPTAELPTARLRRISDQPNNLRTGPAASALTISSQHAADKHDAPTTQSAHPQSTAVPITASAEPSFGYVRRVVLLNILVR